MIISQLVDITPDVSLLAKVGQSGHSVAEAVAELVDNAIDARVDPHPLSVDVDYDAVARSICVRDDGHGMSSRELADALVLALSTKQETDIGKFGLGMKTACTSLGTRFRIETTRQDDRVARIAEYDEASFLSTGEWRLPIRRRKKRWSRGTEITVESSRVYPTLHQSLFRNLGWTFRHFLLDGLLELRIHGTRVPAAEYDVDPKSILPFEGEVGGQKIRGWVGLLHKSSQRGWYGFALIRNRRVVRRHEKLGFQAHPSTARVVGELHLDGFPTNNLKTDFIRETEEWRALEQWVSQVIEPVLSQSRALAHAGMLDLKIRARIDEERARLIGADADGHFHLPTAPDGVLEQTGTRAVAVAVGPLHLEHVFVCLGPEAVYVQTMSHSRNDEADVVQVRTNLDHPAARTVSDRSGWACHNLAEAAAARLAKGDQALELKSVVLAKLLRERPLRRALMESARGLIADRTLQDTAVAS